jgi:predicted pyridoxine 5'-phosphate oxidase superfamily flavin-nucleotide-binding protein
MRESATVTRLSGERMLQEQLGTRDRAETFYDRQVLDHLNERMQDFIARQEWMFVATSDARGACDSTLRAGPAGFVAVLSPRTVAWPEYRGNGVLASRGNIVENPHVGLLFVDFAGDRIGLHVNGRAGLADDATLRARHPGLPVDTVPGRRPEQWVVAVVEEAYIHCAKHIPRLLRPRDRSDEVSAKKSDYFGVGRVVA